MKDVVTLATLNSAIEDILDDLYKAGVTSLDAQAEFLAQSLDAWLDASGRKEDLSETESLDPENVAYQGRAIVSFLTLIRACILELQRQKQRTALVSLQAKLILTRFIRATMRRAGLLRDGKFLSKSDFKGKGFLGSGGLGRFRDSLWAAAGTRRTVSPLKAERLAALAGESRARVRAQLGRNG